jgi:hypothetical protein
MFDESDPDPISRNGSGPSTLEMALIDGAGQMAAAQCRWLLHLADLDEYGAECLCCPSKSVWLSWRCGVPARIAAEYVQVADKLKNFPLLTEYFSCGRLSYAQVRLIARVVAPQTERVLVDIARNSTVGQLSRVVSAYKSVLQSEAEAKARREGRSLSTWFDDNGFFVLHGKFCPEDGAVLDKALLQAMESLPGPPPHQAGNDDPPGEVRDPYGARQADALVQIAREHLSASVAGRPSAILPEVVVHVGLDALTAAQGDDCHLENGVALAPSSALRLSCEAALIPLIENREGEPLSVGRRTRAIPIGMRRALKARDQGCQFPGCTGRRYLEGHHIKHWAHGGATSLDNLVELCRFHHTLVHEGGYTIRATESGLEFFRDDGRPVPSTYSLWSDHTGDLAIENQRLGTTIEPDAISSEWLGDRLNLGYVTEVLGSAHFAGPPWPDPPDPPG